MLIAWVVLGSVLLALLLLATVPVEVTFCVEHHHGHGKASGTLHWLFGVVRIPLGGRTPGARVRSSHPAAHRRDRRRHGAHRLIALVQAEGFAWRALALGQKLLPQMRIQELRVEGSVGLNDPADTGRVWAVAGALAAVLAPLPRVHIAIEPQFTSENFDVHATSRLRVIPLGVLFVIVRFLLSPGTVRALRALRAAG